MSHFVGIANGNEKTAPTLLERLRLLAHIYENLTT